MPQIGDDLRAHVDQLVEFAHQRIVRRGTGPQGVQAVAQADIRLDRRVMQVPGDFLALPKSGAGSKRIEQRDIFDERKDMRYQVHQKPGIGTKEMVTGGHDVNASLSFAQGNRYADERPGVKQFGEGSAAGRIESLPSHAAAFDGRQCMAEAQARAQRRRVQHALARAKPHQRGDGRFAHLADITGASAAAVERGAQLPMLRAVFAHDQYAAAGAEKNSRLLQN